MWRRSNMLVLIMSELRRTELLMFSSAGNLTVAR
jgi:hypothetical protein